MREGWTLATEVAQTARQHKEKWPNKRCLSWATFPYGGTPQ